MRKGLFEGPRVFSHDIGDYDRGASGDSGHAVHEHVGGLKVLLDEVERLVEVLENVLTRVVLDDEMELSGHLEELGDFEKLPEFEGND